MMDDDKIAGILKEGDDDGDDGDICIMMKCLSRKMSTSSWESPVTT